MIIIVSACTAGVKCRYDESHRVNKKIVKLVSEKKALPLCPEVLGGRPVPRSPVEIVGGTGDDVIDGIARVKDKEGNDYTEEVIDGVEEFLKTVSRLNVKVVVMKTKSPTCGYGKIHDGTFSGILKAGNGVLAAALERRGIKIYTEDNLQDLPDTI